MQKSILFYINTPAQFHTWKHLIFDLSKLGYQIKILGRDYGQTLQLLDEYGLEYTSFEITKSKYLRSLDIFVHLREGIKLARKSNPSYIMGFGVDAALLGFLLKSRSIIFTDDDLLHFENFIIKTFAGVIFTPDCFRGNLGKNHFRLPTYKELSYLHPNCFQPDFGIYNELRIRSDEKYVLIRFNLFDAGHDVGKHGFSVRDRIGLVKELGKYAKVFISPEGKLPEELEEYRLPVSANRIHHVLYYAQLLVSDTQTMTTEAAVLGTPVVRSNDWVGPHDMGNFIDLEKKYGLVYSFHEPERALQKALELVQQTDLKEQCAKKRQILLSDKIDLTQLMVSFIENYPDSLKQYRKK